jgi:hypothetical protein
MAALNFDASQVEPRENKYELLPAGWYTAQVTESEIRPVNTGNGEALKLTIEILSDGYRGRRVWSYLNIKNSNPDTERWARQDLKELCASIGLARVENSQELHNKPFSVKLKISPDKTGRYDPSNTVAGFKAVGGSSVHGQAMAARAPQAPANAPAAAAGTSAPPWAKRAA